MPGRAARMVLAFLVLMPGHGPEEPAEKSGDRGVDEPRSVARGPDEMDVEAVVHCAEAALLRGEATRGRASISIG